MKSFIRAAEIWMPAPGRSLLEFGAGAFGDVPEFGAVTRSMFFGRAEGLPGEAWEQGNPILLKQFEGSNFLRTSAAQVAGLSCAVAVPFFVMGELTAVVTLFGSGDPEIKGAMELWCNDPRISSDMTLLDGYYGGLPEGFEQISRDAYLPRGAGLPGMAWQRDEVVILGQVDQSKRFLRGEAASDAGIRRALALPCHAMGHANYVLTLLAGEQTPVARRMERWVVERGDAQLVRAAGFCEVEGELGTSTQVQKLVDADAQLVKAVGSGIPVLTEVSSHPTGAQSCLWLPVTSEEKVSELLALYF